MFLNGDFTKGIRAVGNKRSIFLLTGFADRLDKVACLAAFMQAAIFAYSALTILPRMRCFSLYNRTAALVNQGMGGLGLLPYRFFRLVIVGIFFTAGFLSPTYIAALSGVACCRIYVVSVSTRSVIDTYIAPFTFLLMESGRRICILIKQVIAN